jgi:uncharacterized damage-inducible protein DinB
MPHSLGPAAREHWRRQAIRRIAATRRATVEFIERLPEPEIRRADTQDRWSVKDVLAHLLACDGETNRRLALIERGQASRIQWFESMAHADRFNARSVARLRRLGLAALSRQMQRAHAELIDRLQRLPSEALEDPSHEYTVVQWLPAPGWTHEREHLGEVKAWWRTRQKELAARKLTR